MRAAKPSGRSCPARSCWLTCWFHERVEAAEGRIRRIVLVAMARKLIVSLWRYVADGLIPGALADDRFL